MVSRAVVPGDHPGSQGRWQQWVEAQLERLFTNAATALRREISDGDVDITGGNLRVRGGQLQVLDDDEQVIWSNLDGPTQHSVGQLDRNSNVPMGAAWGEVARLSYIVPAGYTRGHITVFGAAGTSLNGNGNISVQPFVGSTLGPAINSGNATGGPCTASSFMAANYVGMDPGAVLDLGLYAYLTGTAQAAANNNAHLSISITWLR